MMSNLLLSLIIQTLIISTITAFNFCMQNPLSFKLNYNTANYGCSSSLNSMQRLFANQRQTLLNAVASTGSNAFDFALLFDCDGVIVETEELHRLAYNKAFKLLDLKLPSGILSCTVGQ